MFKKWRPKEIIVLTLVLFVGLFLLTAKICHTIIGREFDEPEQHIVAGLLGSMLTMAAQYLGRREKDDPDN